MASPLVDAGNNHTYMTVPFTAVADFRENILAEENQPAEVDAPTGEAKLDDVKPIVETWEKIVLYIFFAVFLTGMFIFLGNELSTQEKNFEKGEKFAENTYD